MPMSGRALLILAAVLAGAILLFLEVRRRQHEQVYVDRMRKSMLYFDLFPLISHARHMDIDRVQIERGRIVFFSVYPPGKIGEFVLADRLLRPMNPERTWAMVQAIMTDIPILQEERKYHMRRYRVTRPNGQKDYGYQFIIRQSYKAELMYARQRAFLK